MHCGIRGTATTRNFTLWLFLNNHNTLWHEKNSHNSKCLLNEVYHHHHHHKHQGLDPLIHSVSRVTAARTNASSVFQLFSFFVVCSGMISKVFSFVAKGAHPYRKQACLEALRLATTKLTRGTGYPS